MRLVRHAGVSLLTLGLLAAAGTARAEKNWDQRQESPILSDRFAISLGAFRTDFDTTAAIGFGGVLGTFIRFEDQLNLEDDQTTFRLDGFYRFKKKHMIDFGYVFLNRDAQSVIADDIDFDGNRFTAGVALNTEFKTQLFRVAYRHAFINDGKVEAGFSAGAANYQITLGMSGQAAVLDEMGNPVAGTTFQRDATKTIFAPVPTIGLYTNFAITKRILFRADASFFDLDVGDFSGRLVESRILFDFFFTKMVGFTIGSQTTDLDISESGENPFLAGYRYSGLLFQVTVAAF